MFPLVGRLLCICPSSLVGVVKYKLRPEFNGRDASSQHDAPRDPPADQKSSCRCEKSPAKGLNDAFPVGIHEPVRDVLICTILYLIVQFFQIIVWNEVKINND